jgi:tRNASer (uridine44-2'-O)-methyltransferase
MSFQPERLTGKNPEIRAQKDGQLWRPMYGHAADFPPDIFEKVMVNLITNPNFVSTNVFRADILFDTRPASHDIDQPNETQAEIYDGLRKVDIEGYVLQRSLVREIIPRNPQVDMPILQSCHFLKKIEGDLEYTLVIEIPHAESEAEIPFYHPMVQGIAALHEWNITSEVARVSIHFQDFPISTTKTSVRPRNEKRLDRTSLNLLHTWHRHGQNTMAGYVKRVHHDQLIPQKRLQDTYSRLKMKYAKQFCSSWVEVTDPQKHVFEDLGIAAFLIELWKDMYPLTAESADTIKSGFPGFVDIGCGNGLLTNILMAEGYRGWGFDARSRKSWSTYPSDVQKNLKVMLLLPHILHDQLSDSAKAIMDSHNVSFCDGKFEPGTFIIANHPDELTGWTPILASQSKCPFLIIPCCSRNLSGAKFRASPKPGTVLPNGNVPSAYATMVTWVEQIARDLGFDIRNEILRIPSLRNTAIFGKQMTAGTLTVDEVLAREGGGVGWVENVLALLAAKRNEH